MIRHQRSSLTQRGMVFCSGGLTLAIGGLALGYPDISRVGVLLAVLPFLTLLLSRRRPTSLTVTRTVEPQLLAPDQRAQVTVTFHNATKRSSRLYLAEERVDYVLGDRPRFVLPGLAPGAARRLSYVVRSAVRGRHQLGPVHLRETDPFGLTSAELEVRSVDEVLVLPRIVPLTTSRPPGAGVGSEGEIPQMVSLHGSEDASIRAYHDGDDLRKVHWPATAHRGELMVRQEEQPARHSAVLLLDSRRTAHEGSGQHSSFEWAVSATASIAVRLEQLHYSIHLASPETVEGQVVDTTAPASTIVQWLAVADLDTEGSHHAVVTRAHEVVRMGAIVVAVLTDRDDDATVIARMRQAGASGMALILDTHSFRDRHADPSPSAALLRDQLATAGWRVLIVRAGDDLETAWETISRKSLIRVGAL